MLCHYCQNPISLLRRLSDPEFCSPKHRESYLREQSDLAIARLQPVARARAAATAARVAVLETIPPLPAKATPSRSVLAGPASLPPLHTREYWSYELPAEPMSSPIGVMLRGTELDLGARSPNFATSVVSFWPVPFLGEPTSAPLDTGARTRPTLPISPLLTLAWNGVGSVRQVEPAEPATRLIPLSILPSWSLPQPCASPSAVRSAASGVPVGPVRRSAAPLILLVAPGVVMPPSPPRPSSGLGVAIPAEPVSYPTRCLWTMARSVGDVRELLFTEESRYADRLERQLELMAEGVGLCGRVAIPTPAPYGWPQSIVPYPNSFSFRVSLAKPNLCLASTALAISSGLQAVPLPSPRMGATVTQPEAEATSANIPTHYPAPPTLPGTWSFAQSLLRTPSLQSVASTTGPTGALVHPVPPTILNRPHLRSAAPELAQARKLVPIGPPAVRNSATGSVEPLPEAPTITINLLDRHFELAKPSTPPPELYPLNPSEALASVRACLLSIMPQPATPVVIVPHSPIRNHHQSTALRIHLFSLDHLVPGPRKQLSRATAIDPCTWRGRPVWPTTQLRRISLKEKNSTRTIALHDVRQALQKETFDRAKRFWKLAPADLKWLAFGLPLILGFWLWPTQPVSVEVPSPLPAVAKATKKATASSFFEKAAQTNLNINFGSFEERIANRASIHLEEDFSAGLGLWEGEGNWARSWTYDKSGVVRPGRMAIYQPSIPMVDYAFDITAAVERRSISWMVRASSLRNYVAARLNVSGSGPNQRLSFERWTVKDGRVTRRQTMPIQSPLGNVTKVKIHMEVTGNTFATTLQDQAIDVFTDSTHPSGGIGLFSGDGDQPRIYRIELTHQHDFFGKLCSFLAPHPITKAGTIRP